VLDISQGEGFCFSLLRGEEVTLRNFRMVGNTGFEARDQAGLFYSLRAQGLWGFYLKPCQAVDIVGTERVLIENCHANRMSAECFVSGGPSRASVSNDLPFSKQVTYLRCSVTDCARNAFNDWNCGPENTSILNCRIENVAGCAWEGASRFAKFIGNYVRNAGTVAMGNLGPSNGGTSFGELGAGQHIVADNVFESLVPYGGCAIRSCFGSTEVIISHNLFINFGSSAVEALGRCDTNHFVSANTTITGNIFDMTCVTGKTTPRHAIEVSASNGIVSDNQIYVRGAPDSAVTGLRILEPASDLIIHDNLIRNCGWGIVSGRAQSRVVSVIDPVSFTADLEALPLALHGSHLGSDWGVVWVNSLGPKTLSAIDSFDPETLHFKLRKPHPLQAGQRFEIVSPAPNWSIHHNLVSDCLHPAILDSFGGDTCSFSENEITRGSAAHVKAALEIHGMFRVDRNHICGFDEPGSAALSLFPDPLGRACRSLYWNNVFERCSIGIAESRKGLWRSSRSIGNLFPPGTPSTHQ
jgi:hypothetical protein